MKVLHVSGKRKRSIARATIRQGKGIVRVNNLLLDFYEPKLARLKIREPLLLAGEIANKVDIDINVRGGGYMSQAEAARLVVANALVGFTKNSKVEQIFQKYDRQLLVADVRRKETRKPNRHSKARAKRQKSYR